ncbi:hypothetical protein ACFYM2_20965 [Streptomyces sp. NPDC006711]|uniref:hypothetical protein n=1 Tax=Streptomyces sp. NPDC006711 TaxID=3364762 RepID=UPI003688D792
MPRVLGLTALCILGRRSGAVIDDGSALYWFLSPGVGADWDGESAQLLTLGSAVYVPPARRTQGPGPFWRICPGDATWHTDPAALLAAIEDALDANHRTSGTGRVAQ